VDGVWPPPVVDALCTELRSLHSAGLTHLNSTHLVKGPTTQLLEKSGIYEAELTLGGSQLRAAAPLCAAVDADRSLATLLSLHIPQLRLAGQATKLQINQGEAAGRQGGRAAGRQGGRAAGRQGGWAAGRPGGRAAGLQGGRAAGRQGGRAAGRQGGRAAGTGSWACADLGLWCYSAVVAWAGGGGAWRVP